MRVIIVGAGIGGLTCAIACRREKLDVIVGAGIQIPPNGVRVLQELDLKEEVVQKGAIVESMDLRRYKNGELITSMECDETVARAYGAPWIIIHRADYQQILFDRAMLMGVEVRFGATVEDLDFQDTQAILEGGEAVAGDIIIGADGLWSKVRDTIFDRHCPPIETGDMAYRAVFPRKQLEALCDPEIDSLCSKTSVTAWLGPEKHAVFYPVRGGAEFNLVLLLPDNLPAGARTIQGDLEEMKSGFRDWDATLQRLISCISSVVRWKLCHLPELYTWSKGSVTLLGDACHPTLPYQAQGAAMASEDGAVLGLLLGSIVKHLENQPDSSDITLRDMVFESLTVYEDLRKPRTTANVNGALRNRGAFHMPDGILQWMRDLVLGYSGMTHETDSIGLMSRRQSNTLAYDAIEECKIRIKEA
ncbi:salicylate hydroxylase [Aspergillus nomiae NRRL 13137]|uniref:Salicylate hydroxylase n=1 Tax=Aspergillus nomiae NRRL (strain ATCC 15546 / NRRL 13137 / CBS 260.88 / M93) TaxID=1509407 RepID=A0A0L1J5R4_ASPN3|nr:salicylate hydroxylase [Aspergillus nomiae NRRL 13137]KNG86763.1 salicylate hydroxylase [Aspergillus nomiae NRRL 13137]